MSWTCAAFDHGVTVFPNGKIGPCCQIDASYLKPITELANPDRFADLKCTDVSPEHPCNTCMVNEHHGLDSYRTFFNQIVTADAGLQFVDIRNTNLCNLKCRYCGPHFSSQWAEELGRLPVIQHEPLDDYKDLLVTDSLHWMYFAGGEPLISADHWQLLEELVSNKQASRISLLYSTNLTTIKYKDKNIIDVWKKFKQVTIQCSIDTIGKPLEYIRSGASWEKIKSNLVELLTSSQNSNIKISLSPVLSILNIWSIDKLYEYAVSNNIPIHLTLLKGPDYLALDAVPDALKPMALDVINKLESKYNIDKDTALRIKDLITNNINQCLFQQTISHVLLLDNLRAEKLFDLLPFNSFAIDNILKNHEYE